MTSPTEQRPVGGEPARAGPLAIEFANTFSAARGHVYDAVGRPELLVAWLASHADELGLDGAAPITETEVRVFVALRDAIRSLCRAVVEANLREVDQSEADEMALLNRAAAGAPRWPTLAGAGGHYRVVERADGDGLSRALATLAQNAIAVLGGQQRDHLRGCRAPGCLQFFVTDQARRQWCCAACGNRVRASRHYRRHRKASSGAAPAGSGHSR